MSYRVESRSPEALTSIDAQLAWYEHQLPDGGDALAERWLQCLHESLRMLEDNPERHTLARENGRWHAQVILRRMLFRPWKSGKGWLVIFWVDETRRTVKVLQVRHESRPPLEDDES